MDELERTLRPIKKLKVDISHNQVQDYGGRKRKNDEEQILTDSSDQDEDSLVLRHSEGATTNESQQSDFQAGRPRSCSYTSSASPTNIFEEDKFSVALKSPAINSSSKKYSKHIHVKLDGDKAFKQERYETLNILMKYLSSISGRRDPTDIFDNFMSTLSVLMRLEVEEPHKLFIHRLLQENALVELVQRYPDNLLLAEFGLLLEKPHHIKKLGMIFDERKLDEIYSVIVSNLICPDSTPTISASNSYDVRNLNEPLMFLRSYEAILSRALICERERLIEDRPQRIHVVAPVQNMVGSASSRGSHNSLYPHTENAYDSTSDIPQSFSLVCLKKGAHNTPTHILSLKDLFYDIGQIQIHFLSQQEKDKILDSYLQKHPNSYPSLYSFSYEKFDVDGNIARRNYAIYELLESKLKTIKFLMFEGPTMEKQASYKYPIFEHTNDIDGKDNITIRFNGNIRESVRDLASFDPGQNDPSLPYFDKNLKKIWECFLKDNGELLNNLFPEHMFGKITYAEKQSNLKLLLALRTCPTDIDGVYLLRDFIYTLKLVKHEDGIALYAKEFVVDDSIAKLNNRPFKAIPSPFAVKWESSVTAMFKNKEVLHYRANFNQSFKSLDSLTDKDKDCLTSFMNNFFGENSKTAETNFLTIVNKACTDDDSRYRFIKTFINCIEYNQKLALSILLPLNIQDEIFKNTSATPFPQLLEQDLKTKFIYLFNSDHFESAYLAELARSFEVVLPKIIDAYFKADKNLIKTDSNSPLIKSISDEMQQSSSEGKTSRQNTIAKLLEVRDSRCLIRNYFEDSDNSELPSQESFYAKNMHRILGENNLANAKKKDLFPRLFEYKAFLDFQETSSRLGLRSELNNQELTKILKSFNYRSDSDKDIIDHLDSIRAASNLLLKDQKVLNQKNIGRFSHQLDQYILGCKIIDIIKSLNVENTNFQITSEQTFTNNPIPVILGTVIAIVNDSEDIEEYFKKFSDILVNNLSDQEKGVLKSFEEYVQNSAHYLISQLTKTEIEVLKSFHSMPKPDLFIRFILDFNKDDLGCFSFLSAIKENKIATNAVLQDPLFASIIRVSIPSNYIKEDLRKGILNKEKKQLLNRQDACLKLRSEIIQGDQSSLDQNIKDQLNDIVNQKIKFLDDILESRRIDLSRFEGLDYDQELANIDYKIDRWYHAEFIDFILKKGNLQDSVLLSNESVVKIETYLRFRKYKIQKSVNGDESQVFLFDNGHQLIFRKDFNVPEGFLISINDFEFLQKEFGFYVSEGKAGESNRLVLEKRMWLDEYVRYPIPKEDANEIKELIARKSFFSIKKLKSQMPDPSSFSVEKAKDFINREISNLELLLNTTNDLLMNCSATLSEKAYSLELALIDNLKRNRSETYYASNKKLLRFDGFDIEGNKIVLNISNVKFLMSVIGIKESYIKFKDNSSLNLDPVNKIEIIYNVSKDNYSIEKELLEKLPNIILKPNDNQQDYELYIQVFSLHFAAKDPVVVKNENVISDYREKIAAVWNSPSDNRNQELKQLRSQVFANNKISKSDDESYKFNQNIYHALIGKLIKKGCEFNEIDKKISFFILKDDRNVWSHNVLFDHDGQNYSLTKEGFQLLSEFFKLSFDNIKEQFYFASKDVNYSCKFKVEGNDSNQKLRVESNTSSFSLSFKDIKDNKFHQFDMVENLKTSLMEILVKQSYLKIASKRDHIFRRSKVINEEMILLSNSLGNENLHKILNQKIDIFHRQKNHGVKFIKDHSSILLDKFLGTNQIDSQFEERLETWANAARELSRKGDAVSEKADDVLRFINHINEWNNTVKNLKEEIKEIKLQKSLIWGSFSVNKSNDAEVCQTRKSWLDEVSKGKFVYKTSFAHDKLHGSPSSNSIQLLEKSINFER
ncbi:MAG: hypothetical protein ISQ32_02170 [Rickettsiales bacterium]|nr:hypothetical protein [Rickettsiales bacterium]